MIPDKASEAVAETKLPEISTGCLIRHQEISSRMHTSLEGSGCIRKMDVWPNVSGRYLVTDCVTRCLIRHFITLANAP